MKQHKTRKQITWKFAFLNSPGPQSFYQIFILWLKGFCMGTADIVPGVSGGTVALVTGIYHDLLQAIQSINIKSILLIFQFKWKQFLLETHIKFLFILLLGIGIAIISMAQIIHFFLNYYPVFTWSLFFGLISGSIILLSREIKNWFGLGGLFCVLGTIMGFLLVNLIPVSLPDDTWILFLCGMLAISAMILPGISGAFILLILGKYEIVTAALKNPFVLENCFLIMVFSLGCLSGIVLFSRVLNYFLNHFSNATYAILTGIMIGCLWKIWPWRETLEEVIIRNKSYTLIQKPIFPNLENIDNIHALLIIILGCIFIVTIDIWIKKKST